MNYKFQGYRAKALYSQEQANVIGHHLTELFETSGELEPADTIVNDATDPSSPIHKFFEWDSEVAACKYRKHQARRMMIMIVAIVTVPGDEEEIELSLPAFVNVKIVAHEEGDPLDESAAHRPARRQGYTTSALAMAKPHQRKYLLDQALRDAESFMAKHRAFADDELRDIFDAIRKTRELLRGK